MTSQPSRPISPRRLLVRIGAARDADVLGRAFLWMSAGLLVSAVASWPVGSSPDVARAAVELALPLIVTLVVLVIAIDAVIPRIGAAVALLLFVVYSVTIGGALSCVFIAAGLGSVTTAFVCAAGMFGAAGVYGMTTRRSLVNPRGFLAMALTGIVIAAFANLFIDTWPRDELWVSIMGVAAMVGLTAWDVRQTSRADDPHATSSTGRGSVVVALRLYLRVVSVFLDLVRGIDGFVGDTREDPAWHARHGLPTERRIRPR